MAFQWTVIAQKAAQLLADGDLGVGEIAEQCGVHRQTLWEWRQHLEFTAEVEERKEVLRAEIRRHGVAIVEQRLKALDDRWRRLQKVIKERGDDMQGIPGGSTGLLVRKIKSIGVGPNAKEVEEYAVDTGLLNELREHEKQVAQELGQWITKADVVSKGEQIGAVVIELPVLELHASEDQTSAGTTDSVSGVDG